MKKLLLPDVTEKQFNRALAAFREVVGDAWVFADENTDLLASLNTSRTEYYDGDGPVPDSIRKKIMADQDIGAWNFYAAL